MEGPPFWQVYLRLQPCSLGLILSKGVLAFVTLESMLEVSLDFSALRCRPRRQRPEVEALFAQLGRLQAADSQRKQARVG